MLTPDADELMEMIGPLNHDIREYRALEEAELFPPGVQARRCYRFAARPDGTVLARALREGGRLALAHGGPRRRLPMLGPLLGGPAPLGGGAASVVAPPAPEPVPGETPTALGQWRVAVSEGDFTVGTEVPKDLVHVEAGCSRAVILYRGVELFVEFVPDGSETAFCERRAPLDVRIQRIKMRHGERFREFRDVANDSQLETFGDWPLEGPRTGQWCVEYLTRQGTGALEHHQLWRSQARLGAQDWGVQEHENLMHILKYAASYDQLDLVNLAAVELLLRRVQTIEYVYLDKVRDQAQAGGKGGGPRLTLEEQSAFAGVTRSDSCMICPKLLTHIKDKVKEDAELAKNLRLAREEREHKAKGYRGKNEKPE